MTLVQNRSFPRGRPATRFRERIQTSAVAKPLNFLASLLLLPSAMELYELKLRGLSGPFNKREIIHLFRIGLLNSRMPCRLRGEAAWRTIGELFPLFEYRITSYSLPEEEGQSGRKIGRVAAGILVVIALAAGVGSLLWPGLSERPMPGGSLRTDRDTPSKSSLVVVR